MVNLTLDEWFQHAELPRGIEEKLARLMQQAEDADEILLGNNREIEMVREQVYLARELIARIEEAVNDPPNGLRNTITWLIENTEFER